MKILIDYRLANNSHRGLGKHCYEIVENLKKLDLKNNYILLIDKTPVKNELPQNFKYEIFDKKNYIFLEQFIIPFYCKKEKIDILWSPYNTFPIHLSKNVMLITTIHDLIYLDKSIEGQMSLRQKIGKNYRKFCFKNIKRVNHILTVSNYSAIKIKELAKDKKVDIIYNNIKLEKIKLDNSILKKMELNNKFYLTVTGDTPSKNLKTLLEIYKENRKLKELVVVGIKDYKKSHSYEYVVKNNLQSRVKFVDYISENELESLYQHCELFLFLSLAEGFGIPLIEAMKNNCKILSSNTTSLPEVLGNSGELVDPLNKNKILEKISILEKEQDKKELKRRQENQLKKFISWEKSANKMKNIFENYSK